MPLIRVFLLTCRRPQLLPRALASLRNQTFTDWVCELHNDAPEDSSPAQLLQKVADPRITLHHHKTTWGAVAAINHAYAAGPEPFAALLEDDNWWDAEFLATTLAALGNYPEANVAWTNMRLWQEGPDGKWRNLERDIWTVAPDDNRPRVFQWPQPLQCFDALHSHGAMIFKSGPSREALVPSNTPLAIIEPTRERLLGGSWILLPRPLANFALTLRTARSIDAASWATSQLLIAGSYLLSHRVENSELAELWSRLRAQNPPSTPLLFQIAFARIQTCALLRHAQLKDWLRFAAGSARHPVILIRALRFRSSHNTLWRTLCDGARARSQENAGLPADPNVFEKRLR